MKAGQAVDAWQAGRGGTDANVVIGPAFELAIVFSAAQLAEWGTVQICSSGGLIIGGPGAPKL